MKLYPYYYKGYFYYGARRVLFYCRYDWEDGTCSYQYSSLSNMMSTIAEGYETGIYGKEHQIYEWDLRNYALS